MAVTVLIKRKAVDGKGELLENLYRDLVALATAQPGYIGAETLRRTDRPEQYLVISRWQSVDAWSRWLISDQRRGYQERIDALTDSETKFEIYE